MDAQRWEDLCLTLKTDNNDEMHANGAVALNRELETGGTGQMSAAFPYKTKYGSVEWIVFRFSYSPQWSR